MMEHRTNDASNRREKKPMGSHPMVRAVSFTFAVILIAVSLEGRAGEEAGPDEQEASSASAHDVQEKTPAAEAAPVKESPEQARRRELAAEHGAEFADAILAGAVLKGMTIEQVQMARGAPLRKEAIPPDAELWHYSQGEVAFSDGRVSYVSLTAKAEPAPRKETVSPPERSPPGSARPSQVGIPPIRVGDTYIYESKDPDGAEASLRTRRSVTSTQGKVVLSSISLDNKNAKARYLHFNQEWNLIATRNADASGSDYSPPLKYYDFPLFPGKTWQQTTTETNIKTGTTRTHTIAGTVDGWETVSVPAGTFRAIRVSLQTALIDPSSGEHITGTDVSWYVPEVRRSVKSMTTGKGGSRRLIQLLTYELRGGH